MPRPKSKEELVHSSQTNFKKLNDFIDAIPASEQNIEFPPGTLNRNIRDVLAHLHHWHLMMKEWYDVGMKGIKPEMPAKGFTWKTTPALNRLIWEKYSTASLKKIRENLEKSYEALQTVIAKHSNDELFEKKRYKWTGSTSMGSYLVSATSSHYDWAFKLIKRARK